MNPLAPVIDDRPLCFGATEDVVKSQVKGEVS